MHRGDCVAVRAVGRAERADLDRLSLRQHLRAKPLRKPQIVLDQGVLRPVAAADHATSAANAAGSRGTVAAEVGIGHPLAGLAEEDAHACVGERIGDPDVPGVLAEQLVGRGHALVLGHPEHALGGVVVGSKLRVPVREPVPLGVAEERGTSPVEGVGVAQAATADPVPGDDEHVLEQRQPEDAPQPQAGRPKIAAQVPRGLREVIVAEPPAALDDSHAVPLLGEPQRRDAAAEAGADHQPVVVVGAARRALHVASIGAGQGRRIHGRRGF